MDLSLVHTLLGPVRVATLKQVETLCGLKPSSVRAKLAKLARLGLVERAGALVKLRPAPEAPLVAWSPGETFSLTPGQVEYRLRKLWESAPVKRVQVVYATQKAANFFGGRGGPIAKPLQLSHDILTTAIYLKYQTKAWVSESLPIGDCLPDAVLVNGGQVVRAIEIGGRYSAARIEQIVMSCYRENIPLEIW